MDLNGFWVKLSQAKKFMVICHVKNEGPCVLLLLFSFIALKDAYWISNFQTKQSIFLGILCFLQKASDLLFRIFNIQAVNVSSKY